MDPTRGVSNDQPAEPAAGSAPRCLPRPPLAMPSWRAGAGPSRDLRRDVYIYIYVSHTMHGTGIFALHENHKNSSIHVGWLRFLATNPYLEDHPS